MDSNSNFVHIPRCAGHTICNALGGDPDAWHIKAKHMPGDVLFTVVRNPYDRAVALYEFDGSDLSLEDWALSKLNKSARWYPLTPHEFYFTDPMVSFINAPVKYVLRFEDIEKEFNDMCNGLDIKNNLDWHKQEQGYKIFYDDETFNLVTNKYQCDLDKFGYGF